MIVIIEADTGKLNSKYNYDADMILTSHIILCQLKTKLMPLLSSGLCTVFN